MWICYYLLTYKTFHTYGEQYFSMCLKYFSTKRKKKKLLGWKDRFIRDDEK